MSSTNQFYQHLLDKFSKYSVQELVQLNNETVGSKGWGSSKAAFRTAIITAFSRKGVDLTQIVSKDDGFTTVKQVPVRLENNTLVPLLD